MTVLRYMLSITILWFTISPQPPSPYLLAIIAVCQKKDNAGNHITQMQIWNENIHRQEHSENGDSTKVNLVRIRSPDTDPDQDNFQNLTGTSLSKVTFVIKFS